MYIKKIHVYLYIYDKVVSKDGRVTTRSKNKADNNMRRSAGFLKYTLDEGWKTKANQKIRTGGQEQANTGTWRQKTRSRGKQKWLKKKKFCKQANKEENLAQQVALDDNLIISFYTD